MNKNSVLKACTLTILIGITVPSVMAREVLPPSPTAASARAGIAPQALLPEDLGSGVVADLYRVNCTARSVEADVKDIGPFNDTNFQVTVTGSGGGIEQQSDAQISKAGGLTERFAAVSRTTFTNAFLRAYIMYTEANAAGSEKYDTIIQCRTATGGTVNPFILKILDQ